MKMGRLCAVIILGLSLATALLWILAGPHHAVRAGELTVCPEGPPSCGYRSIQAAVDAAIDGDVVKVAGGTYTGLQSRPAPSGYVGSSAVTQVVYISKSISLRGGYATTDWSTPHPISYPTTLNAEGRGRAIVIGRDPAGGPEQGITVTLEGVRITGGDDNAGSSGQLQDGGGGVCAISASVIVSGSHVFSNTASLGSGLYLRNCDATIQDSTIVSNAFTGLDLRGSTASINGNTIAGNDGAGFALSDSIATVSGNVIALNTSPFYGGGLFIAGSTLTLTANRIYSNSAVQDGGAVSALDSALVLLANTITSNTTAVSGGGVALVQSSAWLSGNVIELNRAGSDGGGLFAYETSTTFGGDILSANTSGYSGGGLFAIGGTITLTAGSVVSNHAGSAGGGMYLQTDRAVLAGNLVLSNTTQGVGGGMLIEPSSNVALVNNVVAGNRADDGAAGISIAGSFAQLLHNTIARNAGGDGSGIVVRTSLAGASSVALTNTILVNQGIGITVTPGSTAALNGVLWYGNGANVGGTGGITVANEIAGAPEFTTDGYHLTSASAAIDAGVEAGVTADIDGEMRAARPDLGADEFLCAPLARIALAGPQATMTGVTNTFTAIVEPPTTTLPLRYMWQATGKQPVVQAGAGVTSVLAYTWALSGTKVITVTGGNVCGASVANTHVITVGSASPSCVAPVDVDLDGPQAGFVGLSYPLSATVSPLTATVPLTFTWEATDVLSVSQVVAGASSTVSFAWELAGTKAVSVTTLSPCGRVVSETHSIVIAPRALYLYLPAVFNRH